MKRIAVAAVLAACGDDDGGVLTLETCRYTIALDVPDPYAARYKCVDIAVEGTDFVFTTTGLPPHPTYYGSGHANYVEWDDREGTFDTRLVTSSSPRAV